MIEREGHYGLPEQYCVSVSGDANLTSGADPDVDNHLEVVDGDEGWDFNDAMGGESAHRVRTKLKLLDLQDECQIKT